MSSEPFFSVRDLKNLNDEVLKKTKRHVLNNIVSHKSITSRVFQNKYNYSWFFPQDVFMVDRNGNININIRLYDMYGNEFAQDVVPINAKTKTLDKIEEYVENLIENISQKLPNISAFIMRDEETEKPVTEEVVSSEEEREKPVTEEVVSSEREVKKMDEEREKREKETLSKKRHIQKQREKKEQMRKQEEMEEYEEPQKMQEIVKIPKLSHQVYEDIRQKKKIANEYLELLKSQPEAASTSSTPVRKLTEKQKQRKEELEEELEESKIDPFIDDLDDKMKGEFFEPPSKRKKREKLLQIKKTAIINEITGAEERLKKMIPPTQFHKFMDAIDDAIGKNKTVKIFDKYGNILVESRSRKEALEELRMLVDEDYASGTSRISKVGTTFSMEHIDEADDGRPAVYCDLLKLMSDLNIEDDGNAEVIYKIKDMVQRGVKSTDMEDIAKIILKNKYQEKRGNPKLKTRKVTRKTIKNYEKYLNKI